MLNTVRINYFDTIVLIDCSYYVFYRYFATMRWFSFQKKTFEIENITENQEFIESFIKHIENDLVKICKKLKTNIKNIVFCSDCQRSKIWRNDIFPDYKGSRVNNTNFNKNIFTIFNDFIDKKNIQKVAMDRLEADDVIYLLQKKIKKDTCKIYIITNDNDYLQLADCNVHIINMQFKDIRTRGNYDAKVDLNFKTIIGDKSDNIQKIASFITKEKALELAMMSEEELNKWMIENSLVDKFNFNKQLICFENIPKNYVEDFEKTIKIIME